MSLYIDGVLNETNSSGLQTNYVFPRTLAEGYYNWTCDAHDTHGESTTAPVRFLNVTFIPPIVNLTTPVNYTNLSSDNVTFECEAGATGVTDNITNLSFYLDGVLNETIAPLINLTEVVGNSSVVAYNCTCLTDCYKAVDNDWSSKPTGGCNDDNITINISIPPATIAANFTSKFDISDGGVGWDIFWCYDHDSSDWNALLNDAGGTTNQIDEIELPAGCLAEDILQMKARYHNTPVGQPDERYYEGNATWIKKGGTFNKIIADGNHNWSCSATDHHLETGTSDTWFFTVDTQAPQITITYPTDTSLVGYHKTGNNLTINWTVSDPNLASCWYSLDGGPNTIVTCTDNTTQINVTDYSNNSIIMYANDTMGNMISNSSTWGYGVFEYSQLFNTSVYETSAETFILNFSYDNNSVSLSSIFNYNGTEYTGSIDCDGPDCITSSTIDIPIVNADNTTHDFFWNMTIYTGLEAVNVASSTEQQNVSKIYLEECNATYTVKTLNFTTYDEETEARISPFTFDGSFDYWLGSGTVKRNSSVDNEAAEINLCLAPSLNMKVDSIIDYDEQTGQDNYTNRFYYLDAFPINDTLQDIKMYLLSSGSLTSFILKVQDENLLPVPEVIIDIYRYYPGTDEFILVQTAQTDDNGKTIGFFQTETVDYKFILTLNGTVVLETGQQKIIPETTPYTLTFNLGEDLGEPWAEVVDLANLEATLDEENDIITYTYVDTSSNFTEGRLLVQKQSLTNLAAYEVLCNVTSSLSAATLTCDLSNNESGFYEAGGFITRDSTEYMVRFITFQKEDFFDVAGVLGLFFGFFLILIAAMLFAFNEVAGIWSVTVTILLVNTLGLIKFGGVFVTAIFAIAIILTWLLEAK
jgi:hypothetical protein